MESIGLEKKTKNNFVYALLASDFILFVFFRELIVTFRKNLILDLFFIIIFFLHMKQGKIKNKIQIIC
jgi:hypothetical protein